MGDNEHRPLGTTGLAISPIGVGTWAFGGQWGPPDDATSVAAIHRALNLGANWIDTAPSYGNGHSEKVVADAIRGLAETPLIFTKCGVFFEEGVFGSRLEPDSIRAEVEQSLTRLRVEAIDLYQVHWGQPDDGIEDAWSVLVALRNEGKVRHIGVSNFNRDQLERCGAISPVEVLQPPYSMLSRTTLWTAPYIDNVSRLEIERSLLPYCQAEGIGVICFSPLASGLLSSRLSVERIAALPITDWRTSEPDFRPNNVACVVQMNSELAKIADALGMTLEQLAIAWVLNVPAITGAITGLRSAEQAAAILPAASMCIPPDARTAIDTILAGYNLNLAHSHEKE